MYITASMSKEDAERILSRHTSFFPLWFRKKKKNPVSPQRVELIYLPFYVFEVASPDEEKKPGVSISLDGVLGDNIFFFKENLRYTEEVDQAVCPFVISQPEAQQRAGDRFRWFRMEYRSGIKQKTAGWEITAGKRLYYPFWVGYFQGKKGYDFRIMDGVSGEVQGVRMRKVFLKVLRDL